MIRWVDCILLPTPMLAPTVFRVSAAIKTDETYKPDSLNFTRLNSLLTGCATSVFRYRNTYTRAFL